MFMLPFIVSTNSCQSFIAFAICFLYPELCSIPRTPPPSEHPHGPFHCNTCRDTPLWLLWRQIWHYNICPVFISVKHCQNSWPKIKYMAATEVRAKYIILHGTEQSVLNSTLEWLLAKTICTKTHGPRMCKNSLLCAPFFGSEHELALNAWGRRDACIHVL